MPREPDTHKPDEAMDAVRGQDLIHQLREGWAPLPNRTILALVWAGLRVRLARSVVTMVAVVLAIAFLTYTGLSGKLYHALALRSTELTERAAVPAAEVRTALEALAPVDWGNIAPEAAEEWLPLWLPASADEVRERLETARLSPVVDDRNLSALQRQLELRLWLEGAPEALPADAAHVRAQEHLRMEARRLLPTFRNPTVWTSRQMQAAEFLAHSLHAHPDREIAAAGATLNAVIENETAKRSGAELASLLRRAGVNIEATLAGGFADIWIIIMALLLCTVGIANAMLMSVTERFREIGTMKCLGAQDGLVVKIFLLESAFLGITGAVLGILLGLGVSLLAAFLQFRLLGLGGFPWFESMDVFAYALLAGILLAVIGTLYPALLAARMRPVDALRIDE